MSRLKRDGTAEPVSRDEFFRRKRGRGKMSFPCSADHVQDWQPYPVDPCCCHICVTIQQRAGVGSHALEDKGARRPNFLRSEAFRTLATAPVSQNVIPPSSTIFYAVDPVRLSFGEPDYIPCRGFVAKPTFLDQTLRSNLPADDRKLECIPQNLTEYNPVVSQYSHY